MVGGESGDSPLTHTQLRSLEDVVMAETKLTLCLLYKKTYIYIKTDLCLSLAAEQTLPTTYSIYIKAKPYIENKYRR